MTPSRNGAGPRRGRPSHGLTTLKRALKVLGGRAIDRRTTLGRALARWRADLVADLGGTESISTQEEALVDLAVKTKLLLDSVDVWLLTQPTLVNSRKRALLPVVLQRQQLADALARYMTQLGLKRRAKPVPNLQDYIRERYGATEPADGPFPMPPEAEGGAPAEVPPGRQDVAERGARDPGEEAR